MAKTIPTLLGIALLYEVFPLDHFSKLLPLTAILLAVMADWMAAQAKHSLVAADQVGALLHELEPEREPIVDDQSTPEPAADDEVLAKSDEPDSEAVENV